jgi:hypothetical protein
MRVIGRDLDAVPSYVGIASSRNAGMVAWATFDANICASRLTRAMDLIDTIPLDVTGPLIRSSMAPAAACSDSGYAVAWYGSLGNAGYVWLAPISNSGEIVARVPIDSQVQVTYVSVAACSDRYAVVYSVWSPSDEYEVRAAEVSSSGAVLRRLIVVRGEQQSPSVDAADVARGDSACLAVWQGPDSTWAGNINGRFIWPDSSSADTLIIPIRQGAAAFSPKVAFDGKNFWVAWLEETAPICETLVKAARVSQSGVVLDTGGFVLASRATGIDVAAAGETTLVTWDADTSMIVCARFDAEGQVLDSAPVILSTNAQGPPATAVTTDTFLVMWDERVDSARLDKERLAGRRITASGRVIDSLARDYAFSANSHGGAALASDGESFLAVWTDRRADPFYSLRFRGRRFDNQGRFLDAEPFAIGGPHIEPLKSVLAYGAGCYLLCWCEAPEEPTTTYATRISRDGRVMDTVPISLGTTRNTKELGVTFLADSVFVVSLDYDQHDSTHVVRVMADGRVLDSVPVTLKVRSGYGMVNSRPSLAHMGDTLVVVCRVRYTRFADSIFVGAGLFDQTLTKIDSVWWHRRSGQFETDVACGVGRILAAELDHTAHAPFLWLIDSAANLLDTTPLQTPGLLSGPYTDFAYDGANFLCVASLGGGRGQSLPGCRVSPNGDLLDPWTIELVAFESSYVTDNCALAADSLGHVGLAFFSFESQGCMSSRARAVVFPRLTSAVESPPASAAISRLQVSPNPTSGLAWLRFSTTTEEPLAVVVRDVLGRIRAEIPVPHASAARGRTMLDLRHLSPGVYFVREASGVKREASSVTKVVIQ